MIRQSIMMMVAAATVAMATGPAAKPFFEKCDLGASVVAGFNGMGSLGGMVDATWQHAVWNRAHTSGWLDLGVSAGYQYEPFSQLQVPLTTVTGGTHRVEALGAAGITLRLPPRQHLLFGIDAFGGWIHAFMNGTLENSTYAVSGDYSANKGVLASGSIIKLGWLVNDRLSIMIKVISPLPYAETTVTTWSMVALGVSVGIQ